MGRVSTDIGQGFEEETERALVDLGFVKRKVKDYTQLKVKEFGRQLSVPGRRCDEWKSDMIVRFKSGEVGVVECKAVAHKNPPDINIGVWESVARFFDLRESNLQFFLTWRNGFPKKAKIGASEILEKDLNVRIFSLSDLCNYLVKEGLA